MNELSVIVGQGEVGTALLEVLGVYYDVIARDVHNPVDMGPGTVGFLHICFPWDLSFAREVQRYQNAYQPDITVIHSTVPVGTSTKLGAVHSPVLGVHPRLAECLRTFIKFVGGQPQASEVARYLMGAGITTAVFDRPETTELMKILCTTYYGLTIEWTKHVHELCREYEVPFEAWQLWTHNYNAGYAKIGRGEYARPMLQPLLGPIGGHCVMSNLEMLSPDDPFARLIKGLNRG